MSAKVNYSKKLEDPMWKAFARKVHIRDGWSCQFNCGWTSEREIPLVAHHKVYYVDENGFIEPWDYSLDDMQTLCRTCHEIYHKDMGISVPIINKETGKIINEDKATRKTRLDIEKIKLDGYESYYKDLIDGRVYDAITGEE